MLYLSNLVRPSSGYITGGGNVIYRNFGIEVRHCRD